MKTKEFDGNPAIGFFSILFFIFLVLKLCGVINWSWWLIFMPIYFPFLILLIVLAGLGVFCLILKFIEFLRG